MQAQVKEWGNSQGIRLPKEVLKSAGIALNEILDVTRFGGQITNVDEWGKRRLAYEVQHMKEAFYYFIQFDAAPTAPAEIENRVRIMENVVRFLCVRQDEA